jgi:4,4'-diaponeurosporenoate glycosyltransferase
MGPELMTLVLVGVLLLATGAALHRRLRELPAPTAPSEFPTLSIIIPARNEEANLPRLLHSLSSQPVPAAEILVVDDGSEDRTAEVARQCGAEVIPAGPLPEGWRGKNWACWQGANRARGELLLFLDADTWFEPDGLRRLLSAYRGGAFSLAPYHAVRQPYEQLSLFFNLVMAVAVCPRGLFGPVLLMRREDYVRTGGHQLVRDQLLENLVLAESLRKAGLTVASALGRGAVSFRMYPGGLRELIAGWSRAFASGSRQTESQVLALVTAWLSGLTAVVCGAVLGSLGWAWLMLYGVAAVEVAWLARRVGAFRPATALLYPVPLLFFFFIWTRSAMRPARPVQWKGRPVHAG